jgi:putative heme iron utilization protein
MPVLLFYGKFRRMSQPDESSARPGEQGAPARALLLQGTRSVLSTHSQELPGYPFGSVAPYCLDGQGRPVILISALAQHSKNLRADPRASLIVLAGGEDIQANARLTLLGDFSPVPASETDALAERYYRFFPQSRDHHKTLDFSFWVLKPVRARFIGGFGRIHWVAPEHILRPNPFDPARETDIVTHMNQDHADALRRYCTQAGIPLNEGAAPVMVGIDAEGLHLRLGDRIERIAFAAPVDTPAAARATLVAMARSAREPAP